MKKWYWKIFFGKHILKKYWKTFFGKQLPPPPPTYQQIFKNRAKRGVKWLMVNGYWLMVNG